MKRIVLLCGCLLVWGSAGAQLTLDSCRLLARNHYPEIRRYDLVRQTEEYTLSNARREWLPQLSLSAQATWQTAVPAFPDALTGMLTQYGVGMPGMNKDQYKVQLEVTQTIWDGGKSAADKRIAEAEAAEQRQATDVDLYALEGRVDDLYFGILLLDERVAQTKLTLGLLRSNLDKVRSLQRNGAAMQSDADAVEAELLTVEQQLAQVGIKVETKLLEPGVRTELILHVKGAADSKSRLFYIGWSDGSFDPDQVLRPILHSTQQPPVYMNTTYYANKHFDELIDKALVEPNEAKRNQLYEDAQKTAWEDAPWAFLLFEMSTGASNKHLKNFNMMVDQSFEFYNAEWVE